MPVKSAFPGHIENIAHRKYGPICVAVRPTEGRSHEYHVDELAKGITPGALVHRGQIIGWMKADHSADKENPVTDNVNHPKHYKFSNGAEVIDITENLTSNAGQAVQYIARSSRLDGNNKGDVLEDLQKARWFINREIERITPSPVPGVVLPRTSDERAIDGATDGGRLG